MLALSMLAVVIAPAAGAFGGSSDPAIPGRTFGDQPDAEPGALQTHAVYFVPSDQADNNLEDAIRGAIGNIRSWFRRETAWQDGRQAIQPRFDRLEGGGWDVSFVGGDHPAAEYGSLRDIVDELVAKGFTAANKRYLVYAELGVAGVCGESNFAVPAIGAPPIAVVYLQAPGENCRGRDLGGRADTTAVHEWLHLEGAVPAGAPHFCPWLYIGHVCTGALWMTPGEYDAQIAQALCDNANHCAPRVDPEAVDVMFPLTWRALDGMRLDRNHDDYFDRFGENGLELVTSAMPSEWYDLRRSAWME